MRDSSGWAHRGVGGVLCVVFVLYVALAPVIGVVVVPVLQVRRWWFAGNQHCARCGARFTRWVINRPPCCPRCDLTPTYDSTWNRGR